MSFARGCALLLLIVATFVGVAYVLSLWTLSMYPQPGWWIGPFGGALLTGMGLCAAMWWVISRILDGPYR